MASPILPPSFQTEHTYSNVHRLDTDPNTEDPATIYNGDRDLNSVVIRAYSSEDDEFSFNICQNLESSYILIGLEKFSRDGTDFFVYEKHISFATWMQTEANVIQNGTYTHQFLQILRDAFRGLQYLYLKSKCHGRFCASSIAVVENAGTKQTRGKLMNLTDWVGEDVRWDCGCAATMIRGDILLRFTVNKSNRKEMKALVTFLDDFSRGSKQDLWYWMSSIHNYPLFLSSKMKSMIRVQAMLEYQDLADQRRFNLEYQLPVGKKKGAAKWENYIKDQNFLNLYYNRGYDHSGASFMRYERNVLTHMYEYRRNSLSTIEPKLEQIWAGFTAKLVNVFLNEGILLLEDHEWWSKHRADETKGSHRYCWKDQRKAIAMSSWHRVLLHSSFEWVPLDHAK